MRQGRVPPARDQLKPGRRGSCSVYWVSLSLQVAVAVPLHSGGGRQRRSSWLTPAPLAWGGLVVAAIGMLSTLTLLTPALDFTLPIGRFGGLIFIVAVSALLPATRHRLTGAAAPVAA